MTAAEFRKIALSLPEAVESVHVGHPDFRVRNKIFATLGYPNKNHGALMLTPAEQQKAISRNSAAFSPVNGAWGRRRNTLALLEAINAKALREWMALAWRK